jgi:hypothetical protein
MLVTGHTALDPEGRFISVDVLRKTFMPSD